MALGHQAREIPAIRGFLPFMAICHGNYREHKVAKSKQTESRTVTQADIGQRIRWARELIEPNRAAFSRLLDADRTTLQKIEDGERAPSVFLVIEIAHRLRVSTDYILLGSLRGVDGELAARLVMAHPELHNGNDTAMGGGSNRPPRKRRRS
jgi:DNA-binding XRE family transcriptional regulator